MEWWLKAGGMFGCKSVKTLEVPSVFNHFLSHHLSLIKKEEKKNPLCHVIGALQRITELQLIRVIQLSVSVTLPVYLSNLVGPTQAIKNVEC